ncbi:hypothetical protein POM88_004469 [Heracleum sosnowskyi]|uniref:Uncharacterized protein n=1 Tax=Heracleum sosnowskyi TaxID=360622 RepID=A0AAD8JJX1_9APIA|nr:hypothetical protein POM88_004469 [Heracleum sosnowskyi]
MLELNVNTEMRMKPLPFIFWEASYRPHSYRPTALCFEHDLFPSHAGLSDYGPQITSKFMVTDFNNHWTLTLKEDMLVELRNSSNCIDLEQVVPPDSSGNLTNLDVPNVMNNICLSITEWCEKAKDDHILKDDDGEDILESLTFNCHEQEMLRKVLKSPMETQMPSRPGMTKF